MNSSRALCWAAACCIALGFTASCGGDDPPSGGSAGGVAGAAGDSGSAGTSSGAGGTPPDGAPTDSTPPDFAGVDDATAQGDATVLLTWTAATDDTTSEARIAYRVYAATTAGGHDFSSPTLRAPAGATSVQLGDLTPGIAHFFVVRAVDEAGNADDNSKEVSANTTDTTAPKFPGAQRATALTSRSILVEWAPGKDAADGENITYEISISKTTGTHDFTTPAATTAAGETSAIVDSGVTPETLYFVAARAVDSAGNADANAKEVNVTTPEGTPPTFAGATYALADGDDVRLYWPPASDANGTDVANLVYDVYQSTTQSAHDFDAPPLVTSEPGAIKQVVTGLATGVRHYFVVRARDAAGNRDTNTKQVNATPPGAVDSTAPSFGGITTVTATSPSTLRATWTAATDTKDPASALVYDGYVATDAGQQDYSKPSFTTLPGATSATLTGLTPNSTRYVVMRARDRAGNSIALTIEAAGTTPLNAQPTDVTAPVFTEPVTVATIDDKPDQLRVTWADAVDANYAAADIRYHLCVAEQQASCIGAEFNGHVVATTNYGTTMVAVAGLRARATYFAHVRAEDRSGNLDTGNHFDQGITATSFTANVQPILRESCLGCHAEWLGSTVSELVNVQSGYIDPVLTAGQSCPGMGYCPLVMDLVEPGNPAVSYLYRRINPHGYAGAPFSPAVVNTYTGIQEPRLGNGLPKTAPLSGPEDGALRDWILQGALAN